ncbi:lipase 3 [Calliopsis andreniformis]|uniref:lipase 3 n=1 Tax=Calliopsis andreniformis TaxID=337506 RepID=UPI003FCEC2BF
MYISLKNKILLTYMCMYMYVLTRNLVAPFKAIAERVRLEGYTAETHEAVTEDGYILQLFRITGSKRSPPTKKKPVVLLLHGLMDCSATWVIGCPQKSLGYILADWGYDVWLGNARGSRYSRKHKWMTTKEKKYWLFSWHEIGVFDIPAMIDVALKVSKKEKLMYIGHSQGSTSFFVMASLRSEYQEKVEAMFALAPPIYMGKMSHPVFRLLAPFANDIKKIGDLIGLYEFMPSDRFIQQAAKLLCDDTSIMQPICQTGLVILAGPGEKLLNMTLISEIVQYDPAGASTRQFVHYAQGINSGKFRQYDHGFIQNLKQYGSIKPPNYPIENIKIPIYLHYSENDAFVHPDDVRKLHRKLPNNKVFRVPERSFSHIDFIWSEPVDILLYHEILDIMSNHS